MNLRFVMPVLCGGLLCMHAPGAAHAQSQDDLRQLIEQQRKVLEQQSKQLEEQKQQLERLQNRMDTIKSSPAPTLTSQPSEESEPPKVNQDAVRKIVGDYLKEKDDEKKGKDKDGWYEVGKNLGLQGSWTNYQPWLETEDKSIRVHFGGRTQFDVVFADAPDNVQFAKGGVGKFSDGVNFRRARLEMDGWLYEVFDFFCEYDFLQTINVNPNVVPAQANSEANVSNVPCPTDLWGSINYLPFVGTLRAGNMKNPIGLEHITSSRWLDFMERSAYFDTYLNRNNGFEPGVQVLNWTENERMTWQIGLFKNNNSIQGWNFGPGEWEFNARLTGLPIYRDNGRCMVHLGMGVQYDAPDQGNAILRGRWLLRNGPPSLQNTVGFAQVFGHDQTMFCPEFFMNYGPLSVQAEYYGNYMDGVYAFNTQGQGFTNVVGAPKVYYSQSAYVQVLYFLTGEHRPYGRTGLHGSGAAPTRVVPNRNFYLVRGGGCSNPFSSGAWQVGARYNLNQLSNNGIFGGRVNEVTLGLNWFLNPNAKIQWNYDIGYRDDLGPVGDASAGYFQGFGTRLAFDW